MGLALVAVVHPDVILISALAPSDRNQTRSTCFELLPPLVLE